MDVSEINGDSDDSTIDLGTTGGTDDTSSTNTSEDGGLKDEQTGNESATDDEASDETNDSSSANISGDSILDEEDSPTLETQLKKLTEKNQKLEETVTGLMKTIEHMTAQIRNMDAIGKSNTMLISSLRKKLEWKGPTSKIWSDAQCHNLQNLDSSHNVARCMQACRLRQGCTAFNYNKNGGCELRECSGSVPVPAWKLTGWEGYHFKRK